MLSDTTNLVCWSCEKRNENILKECIDSKYNLNEETTNYFYSPLMVAVEEECNLNIIKLLVNNGSDSNYLNYRGECVLDVTLNEEYLAYLENMTVAKLENQTLGMSALAIDIFNNKKRFSTTTKEAVNKVDARGLTPLLWAIYYKRQSYVDFYLKLGADVNKSGKTGITPLMMAVTRQNFDVVKKLVENGAKINQLDQNGLSAVAYFNDSCPSNIIEYLFKNGAKTDPCKSGKGKSPLMIATIRNNKTYFDYFLNKGAKINFIDSDGNSVLSYAILNENTSHAQQLIANGASLDACGPKGKTPLAWSVFLNNPAKTQFLLDNGANINYIDRQGRTALYYAEKYKYNEIVKLLLDNGATTKIKTAPIQNIFDAIKAKDIDSVKKMLNNVNIYNINEENQTVLDVAVQIGNLDILNVLLEKDQDLFVHTALPIAIQSKNVQLVKLLLEKGANVNRIYKKTKQSPLMQAINEENEEIIELLLKFNANIRTNEDPSPFQRALQIGHGSIIEMLIEKANDLNEEKNGKSFLQMAIDGNNINVIVFLLKKGADPKNVLNRLKELAEESDELDILLENVLVNCKQENNWRITIKTEPK